MPIQKRSLIVAISAAAAIVLASMYGFSQKDQALPLDKGEAARQEEVKPATVYVCGAVNKPGVVQLKEDARVLDAIKACGDFLPNADTGKINIAQPIKDGMQITVPEIAADKAKPAARPSGGKAAKASRAQTEDKININTADKQELDRLPGIGPSLADAIIEYRAEQGPFQTAEDLKKVRGIGEAKFNKMKDKLTL